MWQYSRTGRTVVRLQASPQHPSHCWGDPAQAIPSGVSDLEAQLFVAMVDVNGDGAVSEEELLQSVVDCASIDEAVAAGGATGRVCVLKCSL
jgi:hypothetical protein